MYLTSDHKRELLKGYQEKKIKLLLVRDDKQVYFTFDEVKNHPLKRKTFIPRVEARSIQQKLNMTDLRPIL